MRKPCLLPNNKKGIEIDWHSRLEQTNLWLESDKLDGGRIELCLESGVAKSRSLKQIPSIKLQHMAMGTAAEVSVMLLTKGYTYIEAEFYSPNMTFGEIMHFMNTADVTSEKKKKELVREYNRTNGDPNLGWTFPGRTPEWLTTWHDCLKFYIFDLHHESETKLERWLATKEYLNYDNPYFEIINQREMRSVDESLERYDYIVSGGGEGLCFYRKDSTYKYGRYTINSAQGYKMKDDKVQYRGVITDVEEGDQVKEGVARTVNELGNSRTSKLKEDREPNGRAKGFEVELPWGVTMTVSLSGFNNAEKQFLLENKSDFVNKEISFEGMKPTKDGGCPRSAFHIKTRHEIW